MVAQLSTESSLLAFPFRDGKLHPYISLLKLWIYVALAELPKLRVRAFFAFTQKKSHSLTQKFHAAPNPTPHLKPTRHRT